MTYEQLRVFQAVVHAGSFRGASELLHKSQPAISKTVQNLEAELGLQLFERDKYRPVLTDAGKVFFEKATALLEQTVQLSSFAKRLARQQEPLVNLVINVVCPLPPVLERLRAIQERFPMTDINLSTERLAGAIERLQENEADLVITFHSGIDHRAMEAAAYSTVHIIPVAQAQHPLALLGRRIQLRDVQPHVQVIVSDSSRGNSKQTYDVMPGARQWRVTDMAAKKDIIMAGMGWGGLPAHLIERELAQGELVALDIDNFAVRQVPLHIIRRKDRPAGIVAQTIWEVLGAHGDSVT